MSQAHEASLQTQTLGNLFKDGFRTNGKHQQGFANKKEHSMVYKHCLSLGLRCCRPIFYTFLYKHYLSGDFLALMHVFPPPWPIPLKQVPVQDDKDKPISSSVRASSPPGRLQLSLNCTKKRASGFAHFLFCSGVGPLAAIPPWPLCLCIARKRFAAEAPPIKEPPAVLPDQGFGFHGGQMLPRLSSNAVFGATCAVIGLLKEYGQGFDFFRPYLGF